MAVADKVKGIIVEQLGVDEEEVTPDASFVDDLGADSLDTVELVMAFEEEFGLEIPDDDAEKITRVKEAIEYIGSHAKKRKVAAAPADRDHTDVGQASCSDRCRSCVVAGGSEPRRHGKPCVPGVAGSVPSRASTRASFRPKSPARSKVLPPSSSSTRKTSKKWMSSFSTPSPRRSSRCAMLA